MNGGWGGPKSTLDVPGSALRTVVSIVGSSTVSTVTLSARDSVVWLCEAILDMAALATVWLVVVISDTTRTLAAVTVSEISERCTPISREATFLL